MIRRHPLAEADIEDIATYIAADHLAAAMQFTHAVEHAFEFLSHSPRVGRLRRFRSARLKGTRSWRVPGFPNHLIFYKPIAGGIIVLRVLHAARDLRGALLEPE